MFSFLAGLCQEWGGPVPGPVVEPAPVERMLSWAADVADDLADAPPWPPRPRRLVLAPVRMRSMVAGARVTLAVSAGQDASGDFPALPPGQLFSWGWREGGLLGQPAGSLAADYPAGVGRPVEALTGIDIVQVREKEAGLGGGGRPTEPTPQTCLLSFSLYRLAHHLAAHFVQLPQVAVGEQHAAAVSADGRVWLWGANLHGQLGTGDFDARWEPELLAAMVGVNISSVALGARHSLALSDLGEARPEQEMHLFVDDGKITLFRSTATPPAQSRFPPTNTFSCFSPAGLGVGRRVVRPAWLQRRVTAFLPTCFREECIPIYVGSSRQHGRRAILPPPPIFCIHSLCARLAHGGRQCRCHAAAGVTAGPRRAAGPRDARGRRRRGRRRRLWPGPGVRLLVGGQRVGRRKPAARHVRRRGLRGARGDARPDRRSPPFFLFGRNGSTGTRDRCAALH